MKLILILLTAILFFLIGRKFAVKKPVPLNEHEARTQLRKNLATNPKLNIKVQKELKAPVNESLAFKTHKQLLLSEFNFLKKDYGFYQSENVWESGSFNSVFNKKNIHILIRYEPGNLPTVAIKNTLLEYDESQNKTDSDRVEKFSPDLIKLIKERTLRMSPKVGRMLEELRETDNIDMTELVADYIEIGQEEHKLYMTLAADVVKKNLDGNIGVIGEA